ncbi:MAG: zinc ribbon domain-containing protein [Acidimicrobiia bacterium]|nr:zinc ribbon domain-containing protein [Acidimicrobiia bacterium]
MAVYEYRCNRHGIFVVSLPMGEASQLATCQLCGKEANRLYSAPMLRRAPANRMALIEKAEKSRDEPDVVTSLPPRHPSKRTPMAPPNPALRRLPRP